MVGANRKSCVNFTREAHKAVNGMPEESLLIRDLETALHRHYINVVIAGKHPAQLLW